jgi:hypothetical protein
MHALVQFVRGRAAVAHQRYAEGLEHLRGRSIRPTPPTTRSSARGDYRISLRPPPIRTRTRWPRPTWTSWRSWWPGRPAPSCGLRQDTHGRWSPATMLRKQPDRRRHRGHARREGPRPAPPPRPSTVPPAPFPPPGASWTTCAAIARQEHAALITVAAGADTGTTTAASPPRWITSSGHGAAQAKRTADRQHDVTDRDLRYPVPAGQPFAGRSTSVRSE